MAAKMFALFALLALYLCNRHQCYPYPRALVTTTDAIGYHEPMDAVLHEATGGCQLVSVADPDDAATVGLTASAVPDANDDAGYDATDADDADAEYDVINDGADYDVTNDDGQYDATDDDAKHDFTNDDAEYDVFDDNAFDDDADHDVTNDDDEYDTTDDDAEHGVTNDDAKHDDSATMLL